MRLSLLPLEISMNVRMASAGQRARSGEKPAAGEYGAKGRSETGNAAAFRSPKAFPVDAVCHELTERM